MKLRNFIQNEVLLPRLHRSEHRSEVLMAYDPDRRFREAGLDLATAERRVIDASERSIESRASGARPACRSTCRPGAVALREKDIDDLALALALWRGRVVDNSAKDVEMAERHGLRRFLWCQQSDGMWRRRKELREEVSREITWRQGSH